MRIRTGHAGHVLTRGVVAIVAGACLSGCSFEVDVGNVLEGSERTTTQRVEENSDGAARSPSEAIVSWSASVAENSASGST